MAQGDYWSDSQRQAWQYVLSAQEGGLSTTEALAEYRAGGGAIRTSSWVELWHRADQAAEQWSKLYTIGQNDTVSESMFAETGLNYKQKYIATFTFSMLGADGETISTEYRTVESDKKLTLQEWYSALNEAAYDYMNEGYGTVREISNIEWLKNMNIP